MLAINSPFRTTSCLRQEDLQPEDGRDDPDNNEDQAENDRLADEEAFPALRRRKVVYWLPVNGRARPDQHNNSNHSTINNTRPMPLLKTYCSSPPSLPSQAR